MKKFLPLLLLPLAGCHHKVTGPNNFPLIVDQADLGSIRQRIQDDRLILREGGVISPEERNNLQQLLMTTSDAHYYVLRNRMLNSRNAVSFAGEVTGTTLSAVSALVGGVELKSILSTTSSLVQSTKVSLDKNFFAEQTTSALVSTMDALRATQKTVINGKQGLLLSQYGFEQSLGDALLYDDAGTIHTALLSVAATAGQHKGDAEQNLTDQGKKQAAPSVPLPANPTPPA